MSQSTASERSLAEVRELRTQVLSLQKQGAAHGEALVKIGTTVQNIHDRLLGNGETGIIKKVEQHDDFIKKVKGVLVVTPFIGAFIGWLLERGTNWLSKKP